MIIKNSKISVIYLISILLILNISCSLLQTKSTEETQDPIRKVLYMFNKSWIEIRTYVITSNLDDTISEGDYQEFIRKDKTFTFYYNLAVSMYLRGEDTSEDYDEALDVLKNLILEMRKKYYNDKEVYNATFTNDG